MTEKDLMQAMEDLERAEDRLLAADEGYAAWLQGMDVEARRLQEEGEGFADREVGMG